MGRIKIQNIHRESLPALRLIGRRYTNFNRGPSGGYGEKWCEALQPGGLLDQLDALPHPAGVEHGCLGFMRCDGTDENFEYWIGRFYNAGSAVPEGMDYLDIPAGEVGVCWLFGREKDGIFGQHGKCEKALQKQGWPLGTDAQGYKVFFERYSARWEQPDAKNRVILDYGIYLG